MKIEIRVTVTSKTPLNIGSGALADSLADRPTIKDARRLPIIPGSTLKGRVRSACEQLLRQLEPGRWAACRPPRQFCPADAPCPVCLGFGSPARPGRMRFGNLRLEPEHPELAAMANAALTAQARRTQVRAGVGLNRARRTAQDQLLYSTEVTRHDGLVYRGVILAEYHAERATALRSTALVMAGLWQVQAIGGGKSRGLGWVHCSGEVSIDGQAVPETELKEVLRQWSR